MTQSAPAQQKIYYDHAQTGREEKESFYAFSFSDPVCTHSVAAFAVMRVVGAAQNAPAVAVPRWSNFQETIVKFMFHPYFVV
ncbi:hypothetical protein LR48_Vigan05g216100 [Vigna angularis]|uniref:Uncharacterized protein n=1 Tax=Phaseolus angularis TaxID=3914 RepID=A0A0L9UPC8_PHAAN|nr:hypothetical protein LR48_Vigan05g216100 [Vigna angularis]